MSKDTQTIMVVPRPTLFARGAFAGFRAAEDEDYESLILGEQSYLRRGLAEKDPSFKQPIAYAAIVNPALPGVFAYQRADDETRYDEERLRGRWSWGVGGHIEASDAGGGNPIRRSLERELREEIAFDGTLSLSVLGYINDDGTEVGAVHFGILYVATTDAVEVRPRSAEIARGGLRSIEALEEILGDSACTVETWSAIALPPLKAFLAHQGP